MADTSIQWTDKTWNPTRGCKRVSPGCKNCYAERMAMRFSGPGMPYHGLVEMTSQGPKWTGIVREVLEMLDAPLHWKKPARIFVDSMSDLFEEQVSDAFINKVFAVMALCPQHTFQILTKRPERMRKYMLSWPDGAARVHHVFCAVHQMLQDRAGKTSWNSNDPEFAQAHAAVSVWPLPHVQLGTSVEDQPRADERIPELMRTPAAVRFLSIEPLLGRVDLCAHFGMWWNSTMQCFEGTGMRINGGRFASGKGIDWAIIGGESGPGARELEIEWIRSLVTQCRAAGVAPFVKQLGAKPTWRGMAGPGEHWPHGTAKNDSGHGYFKIHLKDRAGGDMAEWPEDLRVREFPA